MADNDLLGESDRINNMDDTGVQNNKTGRVLVNKGAKCVNTVNSTEKRENISLIAS